MNCCTPTHEQGTRDVCPACHTAGVLIDTITLKAVLNANGLRRGIPAGPRFCATPTCPVVYFGEDVTFIEQDLMVPVHAKHANQDDVRVCYCFDHTPQSMREELVRSGESTAFASITTEMRAGRCACEVRNPKGSCCLGDVKRVEQRLVAELAVGVNER